MSRYIKLNSSDRDSGNSSDFTINIPQHLRSRRLRLAYASIPISWYNINSTNNKIYFQENGISTNIIATIPVGNYNNSTFPSAIETAMNAVTTGGIYNTYSVIIDTITNKMDVSASNPWRFYNSVDKSTYPNNTHKVMGFDNSATTGGTLESFFFSKWGYDMVNLNEMDAVNISIGDQVEIETLDNQGASLVLPGNVPSDTR